MPGTGPLVSALQQTEYSRRLVSAAARQSSGSGSSCRHRSARPSLQQLRYVFTPTPIQGGCTDTNYDRFRGWGQLWDDYTDRIGGLVSASRVNQILVIPFYNTGQAYDLGSFLAN
jgi:hypothetical protein